jgi:hypothetical protein
MIAPEHRAQQFRSTLANAAAVWYSTELDNDKKEDWETLRGAFLAHFLSKLQVAEGSTYDPQNGLVISHTLSAGEYRARHTQCKQM